MMKDYWSLAESRNRDAVVSFICHTLFYLVRLIVEPSKNQAQNDQDTDTNKIGAK